MPAAASADAAVPTVTVHDVAAALASTEPPLLVDVRGEEERAIARIPGAVAIHLDAFRDGSAFALLPRDRPILVHCKVGGRSAEATRRARDAGFDDVANVAGGVVAWVREIDPSQPEY